MSSIQPAEISIYRRKFQIQLSKINPRKVIHDFCESTSLHGYNYLNIADTIVMKLAWIFVIIIMTGLGTAFIVLNTDAYINARLVTNIETSSANLSVSIYFCIFKALK